MLIIQQQGRLAQRHIGHRDTIGKAQPFKPTKISNKVSGRCAAKDPKEPILTDAAPRTIVGFLHQSRLSQTAEKISLTAVPVMDRAYTQNESSTEECRAALLDKLAL